MTWIVEMDVSEDLFYQGTVNDACAITDLQFDTCTAPDLFQGPLTQNQIADCRTCLEE